MPELPEVETVVQGLNSEVAGLSIKSVPYVSAHLLKRDHGLRRLKGEGFDHFSRRGKFIIAHLKSGKRVLLHLRMSGRILVEENSRRRNKHDHLVITFTGSSRRLIFRDVRKFGIFEWIGAEQQKTLDQLGPEATEITSSTLREMLRSTARPVKAFLLDQHRIAGLGNIYADEALYRSRLHPLTPCQLITNAETGRLARAIRYILRTAISKMGTTFDSYSGVNGNPGEYANYLRVYGQEGGICPRCKSEIMKTTVVGRGTHFCPECQKLKSRNI